MRPLLLAAALAVASIPAHAAMPPSTYDGPIQGRVVAQFNHMKDSFGTGNYVAPWAKLVPGQYINPTSGAVEGAPSCPPGPMQRWGRPFCGW